MLMFHTVLIVVMLALVGCDGGLRYKFVHEPTLATNAPKIVKGQTTRKEILKYFGPPDIEADGAQSKVSSNMPLIMMYRQYRSNNLPSDIGSEGLFPYSSIDDEHISFFYVEHCYKYTTQAFVPVLNVGAYTHRQFFNKLLILISKKTNMVDEFAFREEFEARCRDNDRVLRESPTSTICHGPAFGVLTECIPPKGR
ncbi:MAG: hypothetical protein L0Z68_03605 [Gammaproteobacteria bacterium]|nr:hypothetical protein [Gammaproteobacteria bacterium]